MTAGLQGMAAPGFTILLATDLLTPGLTSQPPQINCQQVKILVKSGPSDFHSSQPACRMTGQMEQKHLFV